MVYIGYAFGVVGALLMFSSYMMKSMMPLRLVALAACVCLCFYGWYFMVVPTIVLYTLLIPVNIRKALQMRKVVQAMEQARADTPVAEWLLPHMERRTEPAGKVLWRKGDVATEMLYLEVGQLRLVEHNELLERDTLVGEIGLFAPDNRRTLTLECATECTVYSLSSQSLMELYFQSPNLGYQVMRLVVARLIRDAERARNRPQAA
jgi:CRP/FNR family transcriptional regulator, cyclic AMP receptor protein